MKRGIRGLTVVFALAICGLLALWLVGAFSISMSPSSASEDVNTQYNITINNTNVTGLETNVTQITVTLPTVNFNFVADTNATGTGTGGSVFTNTSTVLIWANSSSDPIVNISKTWYFWFNATANASGTYEVNVTAMNGTGWTVNSNFSVVVTDATDPSLVNLTSPTPGNNTWYTSGTVYINASVADNGVLSACNLTWNGTNSSMNLVSANGLTGYCNTTLSSVPDGNHTYNVSAIDSAGHKNVSQTRLLKVDATYPQITFVSPSTSAGNYSSSAIVANITATDTNLGTITVTIWNGSLVNTTLGTSSPVVLNTTGLAEGTYIVNATANDSAANTNATSNLTIRLDRTKPAITLDLDESGKEYLTIDLDVDGGLSGVGDSCTANVSDYDVTGTGTSQVLNITDLSCYNNISVRVTCTDTAGNSNFTEDMFTTDACDDEDASSPGGSTGGTTTYYPSEFQMNVSYTKSLKENEKLKFKINGTYHTVTVNDVLSSSVKITVASTPETATIGMGSTYKFELTNDSFYDLSVKLNNVSATAANLTVKSIHEAVPPATTGNNTGGSDTNTTTETSEDLGLDKIKTWMWIVGGVIILAAVIILVIRARK